MMRVSREEEHFIGRARPSIQGRLKVGFTKEGKITAVDMFVILDNGPYDPQGDANNSGRMLSLMYQPEAMRWRGVTVLTNTPPRLSQSQPGGFQGIALMEPVLAKASRKLGIDQVALHRMNAPEGKAQIGPPAANGKRGTASFYDVLKPDLPPPIRPAGETNQSQIIVKGNHVEHWLNGKKVLEYSCSNELLSDAIANSKFKNTPGFSSKVRGHLLLQDHGGQVWFRNLKIRPLSPRG